METGAGAGAGGFAAGLEVCAGGDADIEKRSPMVLVFAGGDLVDVTGEAEEKSPKPLSPKLSFRDVVVMGWLIIGGDTCFGGCG